MIRALLIIVMFLCLAVPLGIWWFVQLGLPQLAGLITISELTAPVVVVFDGRGVPYIEAKMDSDLYLTQGYVTACNRMFQMDMLRRLAEGELSEIYGPATVASDKLVRTIGFSRLAEAELNALSQPAKESLEAYCRGVNFYLFSHFKKLPLEFWLLGYKPKPWTAKDSLAIWKYLSYELDQSWQLDDLRERITRKIGSQDTDALFANSPALGPHKVTQAPSLSPTQGGFCNLGSKNLKLARAFLPNLGSTSWAVAGKGSASGGALLACDKHTPFSEPDYFYLLSLASPMVHVAGASVPGIPGIVLGRNDNIAWGSAALKADVQDLFQEEFSNRFPNQYKTPSGWQNATEITEVIPVRFAKDLVHKVAFTRHGPILVKQGNTAVALSWSGTLTGKSALNSLWHLNRAHRWEDFVEALKEFPGPAQVFTYADRAGNIGYQAAGIVPTRTKANVGTSIVTGWESQGDWTGTIPFNQLPNTL
ncbi:MAG: penicillin acylase family protein, partial [Candidatus Melainabacteria bacterium]|nr:penicillin acylase family protein [Candidatus Melainabacteria bacterium]